MITHPVAIGTMTNIGTIKSYKYVRYGYGKYRYSIEETDNYFGEDEITKIIKTMENSLQYVRDKMKQEGFYYCFRSYSDFEEVRDQEFQKLRKAYVDAADALEKYVQDKSEGEEDY